MQRRVEREQDIWNAVGVTIFGGFFAPSFTALLGAVAVMSDYPWYYGPAFVYGWLGSIYALSYWWLRRRRQ